MPKTNKSCTVTVTGPPTNKTVICNPDPVVVKKSENGGIVWSMSTAGYEFTGVTFSDPSEFGAPTYSTDKRTMTVTDKGDVGDYSYTILYKESGTGADYQFDPTIHNQA